MNGKFAIVLAMFFIVVLLLSSSLLEEAKMPTNIKAVKEDVMTYTKEVREKIKEVRKRHDEERENLQAVSFDVASAIDYALYLYRYPIPKDNPR